MISRRMSQTNHNCSNNSFSGSHMTSIGYRYFFTFIWHQAVAVWTFVGAQNVHHSGILTQLSEHLRCTFHLRLYTDTDPNSNPLSLSHCRLMAPRSSLHLHINRLPLFKRWVVGDTYHEKLNKYSSSIIPCFENKNTVHGMILVACTK